MAEDLSTSPLLARLLRLVRGSPSGITASQGAEELGKRLASVYAGLSQLQERGLIDIGESTDKRETVYVISSESKRRKADSILSDLKSAKLAPRSMNYVMSDLEDRIARRLNKVLPDCKIERSGKGDDPDIMIFCPGKTHAVELYLAYRSRYRQDHMYGRLIRLAGTEKFASLHAVILGEFDVEPQFYILSESIKKLTDFNVIVVQEVDLFALLPDDEELDRIIATEIAKPIAARCSELRS
jgi:hypothetical protein